ncbi:MAG: hypothetical protein RL235_207 [Chlamydiota bacterium]|jgi:tRNA(fMet)-specific endonuclease VapC
MTYLLDTCILSKMRKLAAYPDPKLSAWLARHSESNYYVSALSLGEIQQGIAKLSQADALKKMALEDWLVGELIPRFRERILILDTTTLLVWGQLCGEKKRQGVSLPVVDSLLASTAIQHHLILVTENDKDFALTGCQLFNPFHNFS